ncbi:MAG: hypothetical protein VB036_14480, partial [Propionicimonas sp.]|nr:hypothetical protein [Propionicimonas sp.]
YNPETNLWRRIANAPEPIYVALAQPFAQVKAAAVGRTVYTLSQYWGFLSYSLETDSWQRLPDAPFNKVSSVYAWGESIVAYPFGAALSQAGRDASELVYEVFQPSTGTWTLHSTGHRLSSTASDATVVGNTLVIACAGDEDDPDYPLQPDDAVQVTLVDLATGAVTVPTTQPVSGIGFAPIALPSGLTAWLPHGFDESTPGTDQTKAWFLNPKTGEWTEVSFPDTIGPLVGGTLMASDLPANRPWSLTASNMVALLGHLYDPATGRWSRNGELPGARIDVVYAGGDPGVLACWGYAATTDSTPQDDCYFLRPAAATSATP